MMYEKEKDKRWRGYVLGKALGGGHSQNKGPHMTQRRPLILRMPSPEDLTVCKAQLLNILNMKSSSAERNFHG